MPRRLAAVTCWLIATCVTVNFVCETRAEETKHRSSQGTPKSDTSKGDVLAVIQTQQAAWNRGDIPAFMEYYWKSDKLTFSSGGKTIRGWKTTRERYLKRYPDKAAMGTVTFSKLEWQSLGKDAALVLGRWQLKRDDPIGGNFSLVFKRIDGKWLIVHDHSSELKPE